jgi:hypothetical protein
MPVSSPIRGAYHQTMSTRVKIGMTNAPREIDVEVADADAFMREFEAAVSQGQKLWWVTDQQGHRHGLLVDRIAYVEVEPERDRTIGFG